MPDPELLQLIKQILPPAYQSLLIKAFITAKVITILTPTPAKDATFLKIRIYPIYRIIELMAGLELFAKQPPQPSCRENNGDKPAALQKENDGYTRQK